MVSCHKIDEFSDDNTVTGGDKPIIMTTLCINEVAASDDFVELYNPTDNAIEIGGYQVNDDDFNSGDYYNIPAGTIIASKGFYYFSKDDLEAAGVTVFGIGSKGDDIMLYSPSGDIVDKVEMPAEDGASYGRTIDGGSLFKWFTTATAGASNV